MAFPGPVIGVVHLLPLPGSPGFSGRLERAVERAVADATAYARGGAHALVVENFGDSPFLRSNLPPEATAAFTLCARAVAEAVDLPLGINALRNDARAALGIAGAVGAAFIRVNVHAGVVATDQGLIEGSAAETLRTRAALRMKTKIAADVHVKHGRPLHSDDIGSAAEDLLARAHADAVIVTGPATGRATAMADVEAVRAAIGRGVLLVGSGLDETNVADVLKVADGVIVGTALKKGRRTTAPVDQARVKRFVHAARG
ncbi:MAG: BtpA/SgcQ family protein [Planctomycetota bacterium]|jgi:membrane complex biogenesis BtpA family protein